MTLSLRVSNETAQDLFIGAANVAFITFCTNDFMFFYVVSKKKQEMCRTALTATLPRTLLSLTMPDERYHIVIVFIFPAMF